MWHPVPGMWPRSLAFNTPGLEAEARPAACPGFIRNIAIVVWPGLYSRNVACQCYENVLALRLGKSVLRYWLQRFPLQVLCRRAE